MAAGAIIMAILGCGDAGTACQPVGVAPVRYETVGACIAAQDEVLAATDVMFPVVTARCSASEAVQPASASKPKPMSKPARSLLKMASARG